MERAMSETYELVSVPVDGGDLAVGVWNRGAARTVIAFHGISGSHQSWRAVARALPDVTFVAPDLRGRGRSRELVGPFGMVEHAVDGATVLEHLGIEERVEVLGHSMGGFVAMRFAEFYADRVAKVTLVDGGIPLPLPTDVPVELLMKQTLGPALARLSQTYPTREAYLEFWRAHPAFANDWTEDVVAYVDYDLVGEEPELRSSASGEAVLGDAAEQGIGTLADRPWDFVAQPIAFLRAQRGMMDGPDGLYAKEYVEEFASWHPNLHLIEVPDVNHYTIIMKQAGADAVAAAIG
jgi:lipase